MKPNSLSLIRIEFKGKAENQVGEAMKRHIETHDNVTFIDALKYLYQSALGPSHIFDYMDEKKIVSWVKENLAAAEPKERPLTEELFGSKWVRLDLGAFKHKYGNDHRLLTQLFMKGKMESTVSWNEFSTLLDALMELVAEGKIRSSCPSVDLANLASRFLREYKQKGFPPLHHSESYVKRNPSYIVVSSASTQKTK